MKAGLFLLALYVGGASAVVTVSLKASKTVMMEFCTLALPETTREMVWKHQWGAPGISWASKALRQSILPFSHPQRAEPTEHKLIAALNRIKR